jgi:hypothetical protein
MRCIWWARRGSILGGQSRKIVPNLDARAIPCKRVLAGTRESLGRNTRLSWLSLVLGSHADHGRVGPFAAWYIEMSRYAGRMYGRPVQIADRLQRDGKGFSFHAILHFGVFPEVLSRFGLLLVSCLPRTPLFPAGIPRPGNETRWRCPTSRERGGGESEREREESAKRTCKEWWMGGLYGMHIAASPAPVPNAVPQ